MLKINLKINLKTVFTKLPTVGYMYLYIQSILNIQMSHFELSI